MLTTKAVEVFLCSDERPQSELGQVLGQAGYAVAGNSGPIKSPEELGRFNLIVVEGSGRAESALDKCQSYRLNLADQFVPILFISDDHSPSMRLSSLQHGADAYLLRPFDTTELLAQVEALVRIKERHDKVLSRYRKIAAEMDR